VSQRNHEFEERVAIEYGFIIENSQIAILKDKEKDQLLTLVDRCHQ